MLSQNRKNRKSLIGDIGTKKSTARGKYTIYLDDEKVRISDEEAKALKQYAKEKAAYKDDLEF